MTSRVSLAGAPSAAVADRLLAWYGQAARDLPWRRPGTSPWGVLVSEVMLQQTPVQRVLPRWDAWLARWPDPGSLASDTPAEAVRQWDRLGYPRRALRLHAAATAMVQRYAGQVPATVPELRALPGVGTYTAHAVAAFAFGQRVAVVDTNVARVSARMLAGREPGRSVTAADLARVESLLPRSGAAGVSIALMELGALVCTARNPRCRDCPVLNDCRWLRQDRPPAAGPRRAQAYVGTDRQVRGRLLAVLRDAAAPVTALQLAAAWDEPVQRERALSSLLADGLVERRSGRRYALPGD